MSLNSQYAIRLFMVGRFFVIKRKVNRLIYMLLLMFSVNPAVHAAQSTAKLSLPGAIATALEQDEQLKSLELKMQAFQAKAVSASSLPDPKLAVGFKNLPTDSFDLSQEPMTQISIGIKQTIPGGDKLSLKGQLQSEQAEKVAIEIESRKRQVRFIVKKFWYQLATLNRIRQQLQEKKQIFANLRDVSESLFSVGKKDQQDVFKAEVALAKVEEALLANEQQRQTTIAELSRWLRETSVDWYHIDQLDTDARQLDIVKLRASLLANPILKISQQQVAVQKVALSLAEQSYKPDWTLGLSYGQRSGSNMDGSDRSNFVSFDFAVDLPLFTANRQDKAVLAEQNALGAAEWSTQNTLAELRKQLESAWQDYRELKQRFEWFETGLIPLATKHAEAAMDAYQRDVADFNDPMQAYNNLIQLQIEQNKLLQALVTTIARIEYLAGE